MLELKHLSYAVHEDGGELGILNDISDRKSTRLNSSH